MHSQFQHRGNALFSQVKYGPCFGNGFDLYTNLDKPTASYSQLGHTYKPYQPNTSTHPEKPDKTTPLGLAGVTGSWGPHDVEVYSSYTEFSSPLSLSLLNQFIRLLQVRYKLFLFPLPTCLSRFRLNKCQFGRG